MARVLLVTLMLCFLCGVLAAQEAAGPQVTGFMLIPTEVSQCKPVRVHFVLTNETDKPICSQRPYAGATYNLYYTFKDKGMESQPGRVMVGVSLNGGADGYPYRWGFRGPLWPGKSASMIGFLSLIEVGTYDVTASVLKGDEPVGKASTASVRVHAGNYALVGQKPSPARPIYPIINGRRLPKMSSFVQDGHLMVAVRPFVDSMGADLFYADRSVVISKPGLEILLFPGSQQVLANGIPVAMPVPVYLYEGITYVSIRYMSPLLGHTFYWQSNMRVCYLDGPTATQSLCKAP